MIEKIRSDLRLLELLSQSFPTVSAASTEIINLEAILNLPKGTEHFVADIHGENEAFSHILRNASGNIRRKVNDIFSTAMREEEIRSLCTLIYYPERKLELIKEEEPHLEDFYNITLHRLVKVCRSVSSKYTRSKVRKALPKEFAYIIEELLHEEHTDYDKQAYFSRIIETIITTGQADAFIIAICYVIQRLSIDQLHILGDLFDRGPGAHLIMDMLCRYDRFDLQWGNHDALWMGAAAGNTACIANVLRIALRYGNMATLEDGYGINLVPLATFAMETYGNDECRRFRPKIAETNVADAAGHPRTAPRVGYGPPQPAAPHRPRERHGVALWCDVSNARHQLPHCKPRRAVCAHTRRAGPRRQAAAFVHGQRQAAPAYRMHVLARMHVQHHKRQPPLPRLHAP